MVVLTILEVDLIELSSCFLDYNERLNKTGGTFLADP